MHNGLQLAKTSCQLLGLQRKLNGKAEQFKVILQKLKVKLAK